MEKAMIIKKIEFVHNNCNRFYLVSKENRIALLEYIFLEMKKFEEEEQQEFNILYATLDISVDKSENCPPYKSTELNTGALLREWRDSADASQDKSEVITEIIRLYTCLYQIQHHVKINK